MHGSLILKIIVGLSFQFAMFMNNSNLVNECVGNYFVHNGNTAPTAAFDPSFLQLPQYIYEVFRVIDGVPLFIEDHIERLEQTCQLSGCFHKWDGKDILAFVDKIININKLKEGNIKIVVHIKDSHDTDLLMYITEHQYPQAAAYKKGVPVVLQRAMRHNPNAKVMDVGMRSEALSLKTAQRAYETLLVDQHGCITEGSRSNVFFIRENEVITPPVEDVLPGITRKHILEVCKEKGIKVKEEKVLARSVVIMEAVFISGTSRKVLPVNRIDNLDFEVDHPLLLVIQKAFEQRISHYITQEKNNPELNE